MLRKSDVGLPLGKAYVFQGFIWNGGEEVSIFLYHNVARF